MTEIQGLGDAPHLSQALKGNGVDNSLFLGASIRYTNSLPIGINTSILRKCLTVLRQPYYGQLMVYLTTCIVHKCL